MKPKHFIVRATEKSSLVDPSKKQLNVKQNQGTGSFIFYNFIRNQGHSQDFIGGGGGGKLGNMNLSIKTFESESNAKRVRIQGGTFIILQYPGRIEERSYSNKFSLIKNTKCHILVSFWLWYCMFFLLLDFNSFRTLIAYIEINSFLKQQLRIIQKYY